MKLLVATDKGLLVYEKSENSWQVISRHFLGMPVSMVYVDERSNTWWASLAHRHWGQKLHYSEDEGKTWPPVAPPRYPKDSLLASGKSARLKKIWSIQADQKAGGQGIYVGTEPGGLFYKKDLAAPFELVQSLWGHPSRSDLNQWFGAGRDHPFLHSIEIDPRDSDHLYIAVSCAGVFESKDAGKSWEPRNKGLIAAYLPNPEVEVGHDPHMLHICRSQPDIIWQQNHCGIFRSQDGGLTWKLLSSPEQIPHYGFALAVDHDNPDRAWVIPALSDEMRIAPDLALRVYRTDDGGNSWQALTEGLPQTDCFDIVFRHSFGIKGSNLVFGSSTGNLFSSDNYGDSWECLSSHLARVNSVGIV
ncbi:MAG: glycosyl hydrolase [Bacteroidota bacterium]